MSSKLSVSDGHSEVIDITTGSGIIDVGLHPDYHIKYLSCCNASTSPTNLENLTPVSRVEADWKNLGTTPHVIYDEIDACLIPREMWFYTRTRQLHVVSEIQIQTFFLGRLLNCGNQLTDFLVCLHLSRMQPCSRTEIVVNSHPIADLIHCKSWKWKSECRSSRIDTISTNFRSSTTAKPKPSTSRSVRVMIGNSIQSGE